MTSKQKVEVLLYFLNNESDSVVTDFGSFTYTELRSAIIDCLKQAMEDGYKQGRLEAEAEALYDVTIGGHKDW